MREACVFVGPSAGTAVHGEGIDRFCPAAQGSVFLAVEAGYRRIGLADGYFGNVPSVWHKEILFALSRGVEVFGSASMGALRAAELAGSGMRGVGRVFRYYRSGRINDDDEVCVLHAVRELGFQPLTLSMVAIRRTLRGLARRGLLDRDEETRLAGRLKALHYAERSVSALVSHAAAIGRADLAGAIADAYTDPKTEDYAEMLRVMSAGRSAAAPVRPRWEEIATRKWQAQFVDGAAEIPPLERW